MFFCLTHWGHIVTQIWVNIQSSVDVLTDGTKPLPEPMLTYHLWHPSKTNLTGSVTFAKQSLRGVGVFAIDMLLKSHNAPVPQATMHNSAHVCTFLLQNGALWDICLMYCGICEMCLLPSCMHCQVKLMMMSIIWKRFLRHWPFVRVIQQSPVDSLHKGQ